MSWELIALLGAITYGSRALALAIIPPLPARARAVLDRLPPALFAGLAAHSLSLPGAGLAGNEVVVGALGAIAVAPLRSLPLCLVAGAAAYVAYSIVS
ncbi:MAG TPA: AzlD domain-containing protein [Candidatus Limnocylindrales bacterium]|nr:AzlD domain-containing protein [Candidatus Limnocylindrales bacterium]